MLKRRILQQRSGCRAFSERDVGALRIIYSSYVFNKTNQPNESPRTGKERIQRAQERLISVHSPCYSWTVVSCWDEDRANDCHVVCKGASILNELHLQPHFGAT